MHPTKYIKSRQRNWAINQGVALRSRQQARGEEAYVQHRDQNFVEPLSPEIKAQFNQAQGNELRYGRDGELPKMHAVHSSAALLVNLATYWINNPAPFAACCVLCSPRTRYPMRMEFEVELPIRDDWEHHPNMDLLIRVEDDSRFKAYAIESKFSEPFGRNHGGLDPKYLDPVLWTDLPNLYELAQSLSPIDQTFRYLHAAQLLKHILGLTRAFGTRFRLLYLYYDVPGDEAGQHRQEVLQFKRICRMDKVRCQARSYQELIDCLATQHRQDHPDYIKYVTSRYL